MLSGGDLPLHILTVTILVRTHSGAHREAPQSPFCCGPDFAVTFLTGHIEALDRSEGFPLTGLFHPKFDVLSFCRFRTLLRQQDFAWIA